MTQQEVIDLLKEKKTWVSAKEINALLNYHNAATNLLRLHKQNLIIKKVTKEKGYVQFFYKLR